MKIATVTPEQKKTAKELLSKMKSIEKRMKAKSFNDLSLSTRMMIKEEYSKAVKAHVDFTYNLFD